MSEKSDIRNEIDNRYYRLLIGVRSAQQAAGIEHEREVESKRSEKINSGRRLLDVEKLAARDKELNARSRENFLEKIRTAVHDEICARMQASEQDIPVLAEQVLGIDLALAKVYDALSVRAVSIAMLDPLIAAVPWLEKELLDISNSPKYRKTDRLGKVVKFENLRMALSFFGIENLKLIIPTVTVQRWLPKITDPYPGFKQKIYEQIIATALSCRKIAEFCDVDPFHAYLLGTYHELGKFAQTKLFFRYFDDVQREAQIEAHENQLRDEHEALTQTAPDPEVWLASMWNQSLDLSAGIIMHLGLRRVPIAAAMREVADKVPVTEMSPMARVLHHGRSYATYRVLSGYKLINIEEAKEFMRESKMPKGAMAALKNIDIRQVTLTFGEE